MDVTIRRIEPKDERRWRELWDGYWRFYGREPREAITQQTWSRILDPATPIFGIVAEVEDGEIVGIANCVVHVHTSTLAPICYLADLFVDPARRAGGAGKRLMDLAGCGDEDPGLGAVVLDYERG
jgi:GNAT superfamily N-acetyltransferase